MQGDVLPVVPDDSLLLLLNFICGPAIYWAVDQFKAWRQRNGRDVGPALTTAISVLLALLATAALAVWPGKLAPEMGLKELLTTALAVVGLAGASNGLGKWNAARKAKNGNGYATTDGGTP